MNKKLLQEYKLNYTLDNIPESLTEDQKIIYGYLHEGFNDSNSSKCREDATNFISGREASEGKHGYDVDDENIEIKPSPSFGKLLTTISQDLASMKSCATLQTPPVKSRRTL